MIKEKSYMLTVSTRRALGGDLVGGALLVRGAAARHRLEETLNLRGTVDEAVLPEVVRAVLDELDEGDEQAPRVRAVGDQALKQHARNLLLDDLLRGLRKKAEHNAAEVVRVAVGEAQLVRDRVEEHIAALGVEIRDELLEDIHGCAVRERRICADLHLLEGADADVQDQRVDQRHIVLAAGQLIPAGWGHEPRTEANQEVHRRARAQVDIRVLDELCIDCHGRAVRRQDDGSLADLGQQINLEVRRERVGQAHVAGERAEDKVAHLDAGRGDDIAQAEVVVAQELREVVQQDEHHTEGATVQRADGLVHGDGAQERRKEREEVDKQALQQSPVLGRLHEQELGHQAAVRDQVQPREREHGHQGRPQGMQRPGEAGEDLQRDRLVGSGHFREDRREQAMVRAGIECGARGVFAGERDNGRENLVHQRELGRVAELVHKGGNKLAVRLDAKVSRAAALGRVVQADLDAVVGAEPEEARRDVVRLQHALLLQARDERLHPLLGIRARLQR
eukprot:m.58000 g.58000  ORF g.58000 m.58000 type:complete len:508 (-) comp6866_c1_seq1:1785-3308(-)